MKKDNPMRNEIKIQFVYLLDLMQRAVYYQSISEEEYEKLKKIQEKSYSDVREVLKK